MAENGKPLPSITTADKPFWEGAKRHQLMAYKCLNCGTYYYPVIDCPRCQTPKMEWTPVSGKGEIYTFCIYHLPYHPSWEKSLPYNVAWIKLEEGPLVMSNVIGCNNGDLYVGMPVEVVFEDVASRDAGRAIGTPIEVASKDIKVEVTLPKFKPIAGKK